MSVGRFFHASSDGDDLRYNVAKFMEHVAEYEVPDAWPAHYRRVWKGIAMKKPPRQQATDYRIAWHRVAPNGLELTLVFPHMTVPIAMLRADSPLNTHILAGLNEIHAVLTWASKRAAKQARKADRRKERRAVKERGRVRVLYVQAANGEMQVELEREGRRFVVGKIAAPHAEIPELIRALNLYGEVYYERNE